MLYHVPIVHLLMDASQPVCWRVLAVSFLKPLQAHVMCLSCMTFSQAARHFQRSHVELCRNKQRLSHQLQRAHSDFGSGKLREFELNLRSSKPVKLAPIRSLLHIVTPI